MSVAATSKPQTCPAGSKLQAVMIKKRVHRHGHWVVVKKHGKPVMLKKRVRQHGRWVMVQHCVKITPKPQPVKPQTQHSAAAPDADAARSTTPETAYPPPVVAVGNVPGVIHGDASQLVQWMTTYNANVLRVILPEYRSDLDPLPAIIAADEHGYRVQLAIQWNNNDTPDQVADFFRQILGRYGQYVWAVALGNEQELWFDHGASTTGLTPAQYAADWQAAEPVVAALAPRAVRVAGDITAGALSWIQQAWTAGLPGVEAIGWHGYHGAGANTPAQVIGWAHSVNLAAWVDEGLAGPDDWPGGAGDQTADAFAGAQLVGAWLG